jgi:hypothetical protein
MERARKKRGYSVPQLRVLSSPHNNTKLLMNLPSFFYVSLLPLGVSEWKEERSFDEVSVGFSFDCDAGI